MIKNVFSTYFQNIKKAIYDNDTEQIEKRLKKYGLSNSQFKAVKIEHQDEYLFLLASVCGATRDKKLDERTAKMVYDYVVSAVEARRFLETVNRVLCPEPSEQSETAPGEIVKSLQNVSSRKDIQEKVEGLNQGELKSLVSHIVSNPNLKVSYELIRSIMRAILAKNLINYETLNFLIIPLSRTTSYTS